VRLWPPFSCGFAAAGAASARAAQLVIHIILVMTDLRFFFSINRLT
jgi:hypothetical protein